MPKYDGTLGNIHYRRYPFVTSLGWMIDVMHLLKRIHAVGVLHGDVHLGNILYKKDADGRIHIALADFGLSESLNDQTLYSQKCRLQDELKDFGATFHIYYRDITWIETIPALQGPFNHIVEICKSGQATDDDVIQELQVLQDIVTSES
jgi:serine/threonine protein kinase